MERRSPSRTTVGLSAISHSREIVVASGSAAAVAARGFFGARSRLGIGTGAVSAGSASEAKGRAVSVDIVRFSIGEGEGIIGTWA
jgi:hypothetical protein